MNICQHAYFPLGVQGYTGNLNERLIKYCIANGATSTEQNMAQIQFLKAKLATGSTLNELWLSYLKLKGFTQPDINDAQKAFWVAGGTP